MNAALASLFKLLFPLLIAAMGLGVIGLAAAGWALGHALPAAGILILGLLGIVAAFGIVALQIENNVLLHRIAEALEGGGEEPADEEPEPRPGSRAVGRAGRVEPVLRTPGPLGRVEPVLRSPRPAAPREESGAA